MPLGDAADQCPIWVKSGHVQRKTDFRSPSKSGDWEPFANDLSPHSRRGKALE